MQSQWYFQNDVNKTLKCNRELRPLKRGVTISSRLKPWVLFLAKHPGCLTAEVEKLRDLIKRAQSISIRICGCQVTGGNRDRREQSGANSDNLEELGMNTSKAHSHNWKFITETL